MQKLSSPLKTQSRQLHQIRRQGRVALFELYGSQGLLYGFELALIKVHPEELINGREYPEREGLPSNEEWGTSAWSLGASDRDKANANFEYLCREQEAKESAAETSADAEQVTSTGKSTSAVSEAERSAANAVSAPSAIDEDDHCSARKPRRNAIRSKNGK